MLSPVQELGTSIVHSFSRVQDYRQEPEWRNHAIPLIRTIVQKIMLLRVALQRVTPLKQGDAELLEDVQTFLQATTPNDIRMDNLELIIHQIASHPVIAQALYAEQN